MKNEITKWGNGTGGGGDVPEWSEPYISTVKDNYTDSTGKKATIPKGFRVSQKTGEDTINGGLVIKGPDDSEFVWIPVANIDDMVIKDGVSAGYHAGQLYSFTDNGATASKSPTSYTANSGYREPDVVTANSSGNGTALDGNSTYLSQLGFANKGAMLASLKAEFNNMVASVEYYGGFYIGRYETGDVSQTRVVSKRGNIDISNQTWYTMYRKQKELYSEESDSVVSGMIWGCQWSQLLKIIFESDNTKGTSNSFDWGNYKSATFEYEDNGRQTKAAGTSTKIPTGSTDRHKAYNIYDIAGNVSTWTCTAYSSSTRVWRGGAYNAPDSWNVNYTNTVNPSPSSRIGRCWLSHYSMDQVIKS